MKVTISKLPVIKPIVEVGDSIACVCGNTSRDYGFYPFRLFGKIVYMKAIDGENLVVCGTCSRIINMASLTVIEDRRIIRL